ncbi:Isocitrate dehydrogenase [NAD] subunit gamma [Blattella germanica]|nr:Isocitrate dehydrogenase [NAD] subunit gamma [Blattella germanica]
MVTLIPGFGIGPELTEYVRHVFRCGGIPVDFEEIKFSEKDDSEDTWKNAILSTKRNGVCLKGNIDHHKKSTEKGISKNVLMRNELDLYVNVIEFKSYPGVLCNHKDVDMVIIRMNTEGEYNMLEHESIKGVIESLRIITRKNSERVAQFCFEYARKYGRKKVTTIHNSLITYVADGLFLTTAQNVSMNYPDIEFNEMDVKDCCRHLMTNPKEFDVLLMPNLYGNIISHIACGLIRGVGLVSGKNFGDSAAVFEVGARHAGWNLAGKNIANPCSILNAAVDMLEYLGLYFHAYIIHMAIEKTINEDKIHTQDIGGTATSIEVIENIMKHVHKLVENINWPYPGLEELQRMVNHQERQLLIF